MKKYIFICQHNFTRSKYAAEFFRGFLKGKKKRGKVYSAGLGLSSLILGRRVKKKLLEKMDFIFVMEKYMKDYLVDKYNLCSEKIIVLNIKDIYGPFKLKNIDDLDKLLENKIFERYL